MGLAHVLPLASGIITLIGFGFVIPSLKRLVPESGDNGVLKRMQKNSTCNGYLIIFIRFSTFSIYTLVYGIIGLEAS